MVFRELDVGETEQIVGPEDVRFVLRAAAAPALIVLDELDRLDDDDALSLLADVVKTLSAHLEPSTLVLVGAADSLLNLIGDHASVERALTQVRMPRMAEGELEEILDLGCARLSLGMEAAARVRIARLSEGLPHYTHLLALHSAQHAIMDDRDQILDSDVSHAIHKAVRKTEHSILTAYDTATRSPRRDSLFEQVLLACALAPKNELGYFTAGDVRQPMSSIMGKPYDIPAFARHLNLFSERTRGPVLKKTGESRRHFYRFENPLLQPFVILNGLDRGLISDDVLRAIYEAGKGQSTATTDL